MEIEAKFTVLDLQTFKQLAEVDELAGLRLGKVRVKLVHDCYMDTAQRAFLLAGYTCRLRTVGEVRIVTLKSFATATGALHQRQELEVQLPEATPGSDGQHVDLWPDSEATSFARELSGGQPLGRLFELRQERHVRLATRLGEDQAVAEVSIDLVHFGDDTTVPAYELEVELLPGGRVADLEPVTTELIERWAVLPESTSKFERGLALCCPELISALAESKTQTRSPE